MKSLLHSRTGRAPSSEIVTPSSQKQRQPRFPKENVDPNTVPPESSPFQSPPISGKSPALRTRSPLPPRPPPSSNRLKGTLGSETLPENGDTAFSPCDSGVQVILRMRPLKTEEEGVQIVQKISPNSISILDHTFTFDSVADASSSQHDIFQLVGIPLVENCLAGFNSSIFAYGQTGSGKTYTIWGPPNSLMEDGSLNPERGLTPRVFEQLFSRINEEQANNSDKHLNFQCRCSFLEIYNEQITDLLDPAHRNLQIREDVQTGVYVEGLTEESISTMKDLLQLLIMGLTNRRTGATSINADSSRSHCVFTCILESRYKNMDDGLISLRTSRINLVDLAGSERQKATGAAGERLKEAGSINRSLSQLGNLINILAEVTQSGRNRHIPYRDSKLTFLLQDSLGGNAKLAMICAISPSKSCKSENFSTLRFAQRAKAIKNKAIVNETIEDDVNVLREQIRQLKDELLRMKSNDKPAESNGGSSIGWNVRRSLSLLRLSLCRPRTLPVEDDSDEEMEIVEEGVESLCAEADENKSNVNEEPTLSENLKEQKSCYSDDKTVLADICTKKAPEICTEIHLSSINGNTSNVNAEPTHSESSKEQKPCYSDKENAQGDIYFKKVPDYGFGRNQDSDFRHSREKICKIEQRAAASCRTESQCGEIVEITAGLASPIRGMNENVNKEVVVSKMIPAKRKLWADGPPEITERISTDSTDPAGTMFPDRSHSHSTSPCNVSPSSLTIVACNTSPLQSPTLGVSPKLENYSRKSLRTSKSATAAQTSVTENEKPDSGGVNASCSDFQNKSNTHISSSQSRKNSLGTTENLATSLCQGLRIITDNHHSSSMRNASFRFSLRPADMRLLIPMNKADVGTQTLPQESTLAEDSSVFICSYCKSKAQPLENHDNTEEPKLQLVPIDGSDALSQPQFSKGCKNLLPKAVEKVLAGAIRREMALEDQCAKKTAEIMHLNRLIQQYKHERECREIIEQAHENKISRLESLMDGVMPTEEFMEKEFLSLKHEHMILKEKYENHPEVLRLNIELKMLQNELDGYRNFFDRGERDVLVEEIEDLRCHLRYYIDSSSIPVWNKCPLLQMTHSIEPIPDPLSKISEIAEERSDETFERERRDWTERERKWIFLYEELRKKLDVSQSLAEKLKIELESEKKCKQELKEALQTALEVHTRTLEHLADLEEKHMALLGRHRKMREAMSNMKKVSKLGVKGESNFIQSIANQVGALRNERKRERHYWRDEKMALQSQLMDTAEALQAAGELLIRLKEAEEMASTAQERALVAENKTDKAYQEIEVMKKKYDEEIVTLNKLLADSRSPKKGQVDEFSVGTETQSWFYDYDQCNI